MIERQSGAPYTVPESLASQEHAAMHREMDNCAVCQSLKAVDWALMDRYPEQSDGSMISAYSEIERHLFRAAREHRREDHAEYQAFIEAEAAKRSRPVFGC